MRVEPTGLAGVFDIIVEPRGDSRGYLVKLFEADVFAAAGLPTSFAEELYSFSVRGVLRGLHFQAPPHAQGKIVACVHGVVFDALVDLRADSPTYGRALTRKLDARTGSALYVPEGLAHGFCVTSEDAVVSYRLTSPYAPGSEGGVRWDSAGVDWPVADPLVSDRDAAFPALAELDTPFTRALGGGPGA
jgi:dTDP-4-dehydrorhamnose 3,5-epimerase